MAGTATVEPDVAVEEKAAPKSKAKAVEVSDEDAKLIDFAARPQSEQDRIVRDVERLAVVKPQAGAIDTPEVDYTDFQHRFSHRAPEGYTPPAFPHPQVN